MGGKGSGSAGAGSGMVNGSGADHQDIRDGAAINTEHVSDSPLLGVYYFFNFFKNKNYFNLILF